MCHSVAVRRLGGGFTPSISLYAIAVSNMSAPEDLDILIENQQRDMRWYRNFAALLSLSGIAFFAGILTFGHRLIPEALKEVLSIASLLLSSVSAFPLKEVIVCRDRLAVYRGLRGRIDSCPYAEKAKIESLTWEVVRKVALG